MTQQSKLVERLLEACNDASSQSRNAWLVFTGLMAFLIITIAGVTHRDLLLNEPVKLPILDIDLALDRFFLYAPAALLLVHFGLLIQHVMLARKAFALNAALKGVEKAERLEAGLHVLRLQIHSYFFTQAITGPRKASVFSFLIQLMAWFSLVILPVLIFLYFQIAFLPFHDATVTAVHRVYLAGELLVLAMLGTLLVVPSDSLSDAIEQSAGKFPKRFAALAFLVLAVVTFSFCIATLPDSDMDRGMARSGLWVVEKGGRDVFVPTAWLFEGEPNEVTSRPTSWFSRNIVVTDADLVPDESDDDTHNEISISFRGRDLRYAVLDRSDLHRADFSGADIRNASLAGTNLHRARLLCAATGEVGKIKTTGAQSLQSSATRVVSPDKIESTPASPARDSDPNHKCASLEGAHLGQVRLEGANLNRAVLREAALEGAVLYGAVLTGAILQRANLNGADLRHADLTSAELHGSRLGAAKLHSANLTRADLHGADLRDAQLHGADLSGANFPGADLRAAHLHGAIARNADFQGADLSKALLLGADLTDAKMGGAELLDARIWQTKLPPLWKTGPFLAMNQAHVAELTAAELSTLRALIATARAKDQARAVVLWDRLRHLLDADARVKWAVSPQRQAWADLSKKGTPKAGHMGKHMSALVCRDNSGGHVARGIAARVAELDIKQLEPATSRRGLSNTPQGPAATVFDDDKAERFNGDIRILLREFTHPDCGLTRHLDDITLGKLCQLAHTLGEGAEETVCKGQVSTR